MEDKTKIDRIVGLITLSLIATVFIAIMGAVGARYLLVDDVQEFEPSTAAVQTPALADVDSGVEYCGCLRCDQIPAPP